MKKRSRFYPRVRVDTAGVPAVGQAAGVMLALGRYCLADVGLLWAEPGAYGRVASDPTVSRAVSALAADAPAALKAIDTARGVARARVWALAGEHAPDHGADSSAPGWAS